MRHSDPLSSAPSHLDRRLLDDQTDDSEEAVYLRAGLLTLVLDSGGLRYVRYGAREVVRRVYFAVRDANWGTVPDRISNLSVESSSDSFRVEFDVENKQGEIDFAWHGMITGQPSGRIVFEVSATARSAFRKNRIGFCILHPMDLAGLPLRIRHADGSTEQSEFPRYIAAQNPFLDVVGMRHAVDSDLEVTLTFEGDVFETEDQRNWIDASFKTFCTPLSRPFPVEVRTGDRIWQRVTIEPVGHTAAPLPWHSEDKPVTLEVASTPRGVLPQIGFSVGDFDEPLSELEIERLKLLSPAHLRVELQCAADVESALVRAVAIARQLGCRLDAVLYVGDEPQRQLTHVVQLVKRLEAPIARWTVFPAAGWCTARELAELAQTILRDHNLALPIGGGTPANFRELNCRRPPVELLDFVTWSLNPQVHAFDDAALVETLAAQAATVESARVFCGNVPLIVGPVTLKMQVNPYATGPWPPLAAPDQLPIDVDPRQTSLLAAAWTLGSIKYLAESSVLAATYYELVGWKGLMERNSGSPLPQCFPSVPGSVFPLYHVFADLAEFKEADVLPVRSPDPLRVEALGLSLGRMNVFLVANFTRRTQDVVIPGTSKSVNVRILDAGNVAAAMTEPSAYRTDEPWSYSNDSGKVALTLPAHALARIVIT